MTDLLLLPDLIVIEPPQENEADMMFKAEAIYPPKRCSECGFGKLYKHSSRKQLIMDLPKHPDMIDRLSKETMKDPQTVGNPCDLTMGSTNATLNKYQKQNNYLL